jgi:hypothetical protein
MNTYSEKLLEAKDILGSYEAIGKVCGVSGNAIMKWVANGKPPRTEYTGETNYAEIISAAVGGVVIKADLIPPIKRTRSPPLNEPIPNNHTIIHPSALASNDRIPGDGVALTVNN